MQQYAKFEELPVGALFAKNGNKCKKVSTRTALILDYNRRFYYSKKELVIVGPHSRLDKGYFI